MLRMRKGIQYPKDGESGQKREREGGGESRDKMERWKVFGIISRQEKCQ